MKYLTFILFAILLAACGSLQGDTLIFSTADPNLSLAFHLLPAPVEPVIAPEATATPCHTIAGNINSQGQKLWHDESSPQWSQIVIDESRGEKWFCDSASAEAAGWTKAGGQ